MAKRKDDYRYAIIKHTDYARIIKFKVLFETESIFQKMIIGYNHYLGRLLIIDNEIQFTERDRSVYHELMVYPALIIKTRLIDDVRVAIFGGGDGLAAAEVLKFHIHPTIVELDEKIIELSDEHFSDLNGGSLNKSKIVIGNVLKHQPLDGLYDIIYVDLTDQEACPDLYTEKAIAHYRSCLAKGGIMVFYAERMLAKNFYDQVGAHFKHRLVYGEFMEFVGSLFTFGMFSDMTLRSSVIHESKRRGKYFLSKHFHEYDPGHLPGPSFKESFSIERVPLTGRRFK